jgi:hypothetical protein
MTESSSPDEFRWLEARAADEERDDQDWATARRLDTPAAYARYCYDHPEGRHVGEVPPQSPDTLRALLLREPDDKALRAMYLHRRTPDHEARDRKRTRERRALVALFWGALVGGAWVACLPWLGWAALGVPLGAALVDVVERLMRPRRGQALVGPLMVALAAVVGWGVASLARGEIGGLSALICGTLGLALLGALVGAVAGLVRGQPADEMVISAWWFALRGGVGGAVGAGTVVALPHGPWAPALGALAGAGGGLLAALLAGPLGLVVATPFAAIRQVRHPGASHAERLQARLIGGGLAVLMVCGCVVIVPLVLLILLAPAHQLGVLGGLVRPLRPLVWAVVRWAPAAAVGAFLATLPGTEAGIWEGWLGAAVGVTVMAGVLVSSAYAASRGEGPADDLGPLPWSAHFLSVEKTESLYR